MCRGALMWAALLFCFLQVSCAERKKVRPPLVEESGRRKFQKMTHCQFGNHSYELEERWQPDLGHPFGTLFCMRCECVPVQRKRRITSRVRCKNIKNDCPKPSCEDPVLLPQRCCKTCPGEDYADLEEGIATRKLESEDEDKILKEFTVLLTGRMLVPPVPVSGAARGYLVYTKRDLHYTIHYDGVPRPSTVRFSNEEGDILEEHDLPPAPHHTQGSKVCGVWRRVPKVYRRLLQKDRLLFVLVSPDHPDGMLAGRVLKHDAINTEAYGSLLLPAGDVVGSGGMADIFPVADSIHVSLGFNGIFTSKDARDVPLLVSLSSEDADGGMQLVTHTSITLPKAHPDYNHATVKLDLAPSLLEKLSSGALELRISSKDGLRQHKGRIMPKVTCNVFQAVVTTTQVTDYSRDPVIGFMVLDIGPEGFIHYKLHLSDPNLDSVVVQLETEVETPGGGIQTNVLQRVTQNLTDSWGNGSFRHRASQEVEMMLSDDLVVTVHADTPPIAARDAATSERSRRSEKSRMELRGQVRQRLYTDALLNEHPLLLSGVNSSAGGVAWLSVDRECVLHYQVSVSGLEGEARLEMLQVRPGKHHAPPLTRVLRKLDGDQIEDLVEDLDGRSLAFLQAGYTYLVVTSKMPGKARAVHLRAKINELTTPGECLPRYDVSSMQRGGGGGGGGGAYQDGFNDVYGGTDSPHNCVYEDTLYDDGTQWKAEHRECSMCSCQRGKVVCEETVCPEPVCDHPLALPGECCPFCPGNSTSDSHRAQRLCFFDQGDKKYHVAGSRWHPYIPPFGFNRCSVCTCEPKTLTVKCDRITCPPLTCADKESFRENSTSCCKKCPNTVSLKSHVIVPPSAGHLGDQGGEKTAAAREILATGGCKSRGQVYPNGDEWHPTIEPYGVEKCVKCHCKDGRAKCRRKKCPKETCPVKVPGEDGCCERCLDSSESTSRSSEGSAKGKKRRKERERRHRKIRQPKERPQ